MQPPRQRRDRHYRASMDHYFEIERELGWRYEYYDGRVHIERRPFGIPMALELPGPAAPETEGLVQFEAAIHLYPLKPVFKAAFGPSIEYSDLPRRDVDTFSREALEGYAAGKRGKPIPEASWVVMRRGRPVGALLTHSGPCIDLLFVHPRCQREGLGTALLARACANLAGYSQIGSRVHCNNHISYGWHLRNGFREVPDHWTCSARASIVSAKLSRAERLGEDTTELERQWRELRDRADELRERWLQSLR